MNGQLNEYWMKNYLVWKENRTTEEIGQHLLQYTYDLPQSFFFAFYHTAC